MSQFKPFVRQLGEHLDGWGNVCRCQRTPSVPADTQSPNIKTAPVVSPAKPTRVPTWADHEMQEAERKGHQIYIQSRDWGKVSK